MKVQVLAGSGISGSVLDVSDPVVVTVAAFAVDTSPINVLSGASVVFLSISVFVSLAASTVEPIVLVVVGLKTAKVVVSGDIADVSEIVDQHFLRFSLRCHLCRLSYHD